MTNRFIASHGIGATCLEPFDMTWCMFDSGYFDEKKRVIPISICVKFGEFNVQI